MYSRILSLSSAALLLSACAIPMPATQVESAAPLQWQAPLPHHGSVGALAQWWQQQGDPLLVELIEAAQTVSSDVAQALARVESARAQRTSANAALLPSVDASVSASRGVSQIGVPVATTQTASLQASWELDLVGANRIASNAADAQLQGNQALWHNARVSVAAEVANTYYDLATCYQLLEVVRKDAASRQETARLTQLNAKAGFAAPSTAAVARASAADGASRVTQQQAACDLDIKALVALTAMPEPDLRRKMAANLASKAEAAPISVASVPAQTLAQRPDVFAAERDVLVASAQVGSAKAQRYPSLTLSGSVGAMRYTSLGTETNLDTWSFGPLALSVPLFDAGKRKANVISAEVAYAQAVSTYRAKVRQAVREVEEALVNLQSTEARKQDAAVSADNYAQALTATQALYNQGLASLLELEEARRNALSARSAQLNLVLERNRAWVALYRALGGGFEPDAVSSAAVTASTTQP
ncbi:efflux transporter outer membrane subunit [Curvibacter sp. CHRR-16]|nr:efflux transporter outer membrane subunit [Curvibacter sp. CHRR-16]